MCSVPPRWCADVSGGRANSRGGSCTPVWTVRRGQTGPGGEAEPGGPPLFSSPAGFLQWRKLRPRGPWFAACQRGSQSGASQRPGSRTSEDSGSSFQPEGPLAPPHSPTSGPAYSSTEPEGSREQRKGALSERSALAWAVCSPGGASVFHPSDGGLG